MSRVCLRECAAFDNHIHENVVIPVPLLTQLYPADDFMFNYGCLCSIEAAILIDSTKNKACHTSEQLVDIHPKKQFFQPWGSSLSFPLGTPCPEGLDYCSEP